MEWQPIETAPKDGTPVLVLFAKDPNDADDEDWILVVEWHDMGSELAFPWRAPDGGTGYNPERATHWMPLPNPPTD